MKDFQFLNIPTDDTESRLPEWTNNLIDWYHGLRVIRSVKYFYQRRTRGWDDRELWNFDWTLAKYALPRLKRFKQETFAYPSGLTVEEWDHILDEMIWSFEYILTGQWDEDMVKWELDEARCSAGCELFGKYFRALWW